MSLYDTLRTEYWQEFEVKKSRLSSEHNNPQEIIIKQNQLDVNKLKEYKLEIYQNFDFCPQSWNQFIAQDEAKERAKTIIKKIRKGLKSHFLVDGIKGHGKSTYVRLIAKEIDAELIEIIGKQLNIDNLVDYLNKICDSKKEHVMFFVDEIDTTKKEILKVLNPIVYNFKISGKQLRNFIFAGATINKHILIENNEDFLDRLPIHIKFTRYNEKHIQQILVQCVNQLYKNEYIVFEDLKLISQNCKFNPRTAISLLEEQIVERDIQKVFKNWHIIKNGLTNIDIKLLLILNKLNKQIGSKSLALQAGLKEKEYLNEYEPYLIEFGYMKREPSRIITDKGKNFLKELRYA